MRILFLTTLNLATNPRLVKELDLAVDKKYDVELICFEFDNWSYQPNEQLKQRFSNIKIHTINAGRRPLVSWLVSVITEKSNRFFAKIFSLELQPLSQAVTRRSNMIIKELENIDSADLVIGHNAGALVPALLAAQKFKCQAGFDVEDYYPGEGSNDSMRRLNKSLLKQGLPKLNYVSFAAPLIRKQIEADLGEQIPNCVTVLNYFPIAEFSTPSNKIEGPLQMIWFSQNITHGRGLELVIPAIKNFAGKVELHLTGNISASFRDDYLLDAQNITVHAPISQKELHHSLVNYDIGLALEAAKDLNNELALSNKILAYLQAGLYVVATNTPAQEDFLKSFPDHGICFNYRENNFETILTAILENKAFNREGKISRFQNFMNRNWEGEASKLASEWDLLSA